MAEWNLEKSPLLNQLLVELLLKPRHVKSWPLTILPGSAAFRSCVCMYSGGYCMGVGGRKKGLWIWDLGVELERRLAFGRPLWAPVFPHVEWEPPKDREPPYRLVVKEYNIVTKKVNFRGMKSSCFAVVKLLNLSVPHFVYLWDGMMIILWTS